MAKGYTKDNYPIVWRRKWSHEQCLKERDRLINTPADTLVKEALAKLPKTKVVDEVEVDLPEKEESLADAMAPLNPDEQIIFTVKEVDRRNIVAEINGRTLYFTSMEAFGKALKDAVVRKNIA